MSLSQSLQQKLLQKLSPQQIQLMKLLQVPTANLEERIKEELEENPALEQGEEGHEDEYTDELKDEFDSVGEEEVDPDGSADDYENVDISEYVVDDDGEIADYKTKDDNYPEMDDQKVIPIKVETSFHELVLNQLGMLELDERSYRIAEQVVGSLDDDGYLRRELTSIADDLAFRQSLIVEEKEIEAIIVQIQQFDPAGIAARDLQECLLLQLKRKTDEGKSVELAVQILTKYFDEFTKKHYEKIQKSLGLTDDQLKEVIGQIIKLNPKPGGNVGEMNKAENYIVPDFFVINNNGLLELTLNSKNAPDLRVSEGYKDMLKDYEKGSKKDKRQKEAVLFIKQKIDSARWFIDMIKQRQDTLVGTMGAIMKHQQEFFLTGDETTMRPMILKDIAELTGLDISTVSRVANSKFVQTEFGTYRLKFFFSESLSTESGEEVSTREVKKILSDMIESEDKHKPLSDEVLTEMLQEKGYNIARRTVAKYREQLNVPVARLRKEL
ncbi:MAG TPA: RNA polymerase factor sigma-54 [Sediminibacterium sp.]|uniref:RNA polymerase factor sigma-54 n=1 Tax=Sediminibacterium sp. TaxID=1917865 RepID=UPI0008AF6952|nr:RNA polymerase factor sigma-54 [Sediminibacterium sp.]MBT9485658.1 RNA polymerase factor sigma-54 [Sediminibacterium sp.]OHC86711.1 MAG: RNA polymerase sigma-54 factor [Sphingobacteriia bacterium RIFOXYC2_FULL_35_18]OHC88431.1 MAG: RNA polymerase sigma-54 factor [Sphingobacteriia bacterium RIFOXYD2_FULL_35_12]HLD51930.1 RNA polymerase factor sigma-54 [Sediminibacterium sp.]